MLNKKFVYIASYFFSCSKLLMYRNDDVLLQVSRYDRNIQRGLLCTRRSYPKCNQGCTGECRSHLPIVVAFLTFTYCGCISHIYLLWLHFSLYTISVTYIIVNIFCFIWLEAVNQLLEYVFTKIDVACQYNSTIVV